MNRCERRILASYTFSAYSRHFHFGNLTSAYLWLLFLVPGSWPLVGLLTASICPCRSRLLDPEAEFL